MTELRSIDLDSRTDESDEAFQRGKELHTEVSRKSTGTYHIADEEVEIYEDGDTYLVSCTCSADAREPCAHAYAVRVAEAMERLRIPPQSEYDGSEGIETQFVDMRDRGGAEP